MVNVRFLICFVVFSIATHTSARAQFKRVVQRQMFSTDGKRLLDSGVNQNPKVIVYDVATGKSICNKVFPEDDHFGFDSVINHDGTVVAVNYVTSRKDGLLYLLDVDKREIFFKIPGRMHSLDLSADGKWMTGSQDEITLWNIHDRDNIHQWSLGALGTQLFTPDSSYCVITRTIRKAEQFQTQIDVIDLMSMAMDPEANYKDFIVQQWSLPEPSVMSLISDDSKYLAVQGRNLGEVYLFDLRPDQNPKLKRSTIPLTRNIQQESEYGNFCFVNTKQGIHLLTLGETSDGVEKPNSPTKTFVASMWALNDENQPRQVYQSPTISNLISSAYPQVDVNCQGNRALISIPNDGGRTANTLLFDLENRIVVKNFDGVPRFDATRERIRVIDGDKSVASFVEIYNADDGKPVGRFPDAAWDQIGCGFQPQ